MEVLKQNAEYVKINHVYQFRYFISHGTRDTFTKQVQGSNTVLLLYCSLNATRRKFNLTLDAD